MSTTTRRTEERLLELELQNRSLKTEEWLDTKQAAAFLGITEGSLRNMVCRRKLSYHKLGSRNRYAKSELQDLIVPARKEESNGY